MRILFVCNYKPGIGGISGQVEILQAKLREEGHITETFSTKASVWHRLWMRARLKQVAVDYDVLHVHCCSGWGFLPAVLGVSVAKRLGKRVVLTYHGGGGEQFFKRHPHLVRHYLTQTDANIVLSGFLAKVFLKHRLPYTIIPNILELDNSRFRQRDPVEPNFICTRAHEPLYNIPCLLRAFQLIKKEQLNATLTLVGGGSEHEHLKRMSAEMGLDGVVFIGKVANDEIYHYLDSADIMVSTPQIDNMPVSILEGMNAGLLVISSNVGGVPYMIEHERNGLLFENDNHEQLAGWMLWAMKHQTLAQLIALEGHQYVKQYSWTAVRDKLLPLYQNQ